MTEITEDESGGCPDYCVVIFHDQKNPTGTQSIRYALDRLKNQLLFLIGSLYRELF